MAAFRCAAHQEGLQAISLITVCCGMHDHLIDAISGPHS